MSLLEWWLGMMKKPAIERAAERIAVIKKIHSHPIVASRIPPRRTPIV